MKVGPALINTNINHTYMITTLALRDFASIANDLDSRGLHKEADFIDSIIFKYSQTTGYERTLDKSQRAVQMEAVATKAIEFIKSALQAGGLVGKAFADTNIPGLAFVGQLLITGTRLPGMAAGLASSVKPIWNKVVEMIKKVKAGKLGKVCLSAADLGTHKESIVFLLSLLSGPFAAGINTALGVANTLKELGVPTKELKFCVGKELNDLAETFAKGTMNLGKKYEKEIYEFMARNHNVKTFDPLNDKNPTAIA